MENSAKKVLLIMTYYTLIGLVVALSALFIARVATTAGIATWIRVIYYIWSGVLILLVLYDIICTAQKQMKYISGFILFVMTAAAIVMACILFANLDVFNLLGTATEVTYTNLLFMCFTPMILAIVAYCVGERLLNKKALKSNK